MQYKQYRSGRGVSRRQSPSDTTLRQKVVRYGIIAFLAVLIYLLFFSGQHRIKYLQVVGNEAVNTQEIEEMIWELLDERWLLIFKRDNYFLASENYLLTEIGKHYAFEEISIDKHYPDTISLRLKERLGRLVWQSGEKYYVIDGQGMVTRELHEIHLIEKMNIPVTRDKSQVAVNIGDKILSDSVINSLIDTHQLYGQYITEPRLKLAEIEVDDATANFYRIITSSAIEIHMNDQLNVETQLEKLRLVLSAGSIDLNSVSYINLRIPEQV
ncbi:MAG: hypothetical protein NUV82_04165, partial [Candidatus Komeilibacteria bacterium]|nr:hypothetical protein [Candidatus Komeilibacteria bacterium]